MGIFNRSSQNGGLMDEIRWGALLRVKDGEGVVFVYKQKNGVMQIIL